MEFINLKSIDLKIGKLKIDETIGDVVVSNNLTSAVNKQYIDDITSGISELVIDSSIGYTYSTNDILNKFIIRKTNGSSKYDTLPLSDEIIKKYYSGFSWEFYIKNEDNIVDNPITSSQLNTYTYNSVIILNNQDFIISGKKNLENIVINPGSIAHFKCNIYNDKIYIFYTNCISENLANSYTIDNDNINFKFNSNSYQILNNYKIFYNTETGNNNIPAVQNCIFNIVISPSITNTVTAILPTFNELNDKLFYDSDGLTFNFIIKLTSFHDILPELYAFNIISTDVNIIIDTNSLTTLQFSARNWKYIEYMGILTGNSFTFYCIGYYDIQTRYV